MIRRGQSAISQPIAWIIIIIINHHYNHYNQHHHHQYNHHHLHYHHHLDLAGEGVGVGIGEAGGRAVLDEGHDEDDAQDERGDDGPHGDPVVLQHSRDLDAHLLDVGKEPPEAIDVHHEDDLGEGADEEAPGAGVGVDEGEHEDAAVGGAGQPEQETQDGGADDDLALVDPGLGPLVHHGGGYGLHHGELRVQAEGDQHSEEEERPDRGKRHLGHGAGVGDEGEARAALNNK